MQITYNHANFSKTFHHLRSLFGISIGLIDVDKKWCINSFTREKGTFCEMVNKTPELQQRCQKCDEKLLEQCQKTGKIAWHFCHAGLFEATMPIIKDDVIVGYLSFGQVRSETSKYRLNNDDKKLITAYHELPLFSNEKLEQLKEFISQIHFLNNILVVEDGGFMQLITTYIKENLQKDLSIKNLCHMFDVSKNYLYKHFHESYGTGVNEYIIQRRINAAKKLLRETDDLIYVIAQKVGFDDCTYFSRMFKNIVGLTPNQYRKQFF